MSCPRCNASPNAVYQGDVSPADLETLLENLAPANLSEFAKRVRELRANKGSAHLTYEVRIHRGEVAEERFLPDKWLTRRKA